ncbi:MAG: membrane protein insertase YidC, partial [Candidatus Omnitrophica bacterium]|nr:membrane protein insertase YidC [Candidatus Omnitrophota bacterium]
MNQNKRLILALAMSLAILFVFQEIYKPARTKALPAEHLQQTTYSVKQTEAGFNAILTEEKKVINKEVAGQEVILEGNGLRATLTNEGALINRIEVNDIAGDQLVNLVGTEEKKSKLFSLSIDSIPNSDSATYSVIDSNDSVEFTNTFDDIKVTKRYSVSKEREEILMRLTLSNMSSLTKNLTYSLGGPSEVQETEQVKGSNFIEAAIDINGDVFRKNGVKGQLSKEGIITWLAISSRYFAVILKPVDEMASFTLTQSKTESLSVSVRSKIIAIPPLQEVSYEYILYVCPMIEKKLKQYNMGIEKVIN